MGGDVAEGCLNEKERGRNPPQRRRIVTFEALVQPLWQ